MSRTGWLSDRGSGRSLSVFGLNDKIVGGRVEEEDEGEFACVSCFFLSAVL
jgi:hypothetical protein